MMFCRQQALDNINMLLQDPRPLEAKRDELAKVMLSTSYSYECLHALWGVMSSMIASIV